MMTNEPATPVVISTPARAPRLEFLDSIRALAAVYVVVHHAWLTTFVSYPKNVGPSGLAWLLYGQLAVAVFIVVSGFSLTLAGTASGYELVGGPRRFFRRRAWRILPPYWAALVASELVLATLVHAKVPEAGASLKGFVVHFFLLQDIIGSPTPNGAFWSIAIEWQIYFLFPALLLMYRRWSPPVATALTTAGVIGVYLLATNIDGFQKLLQLIPQFLALFVFGMLAAGVTRPDRRERWARVPWGLIALVTGVALVVVIIVVGSEEIVAQYFWVELALGVTVASLLAALASPSPGAGTAVVRRALEARPFVFVGAFSYSLYLMHVPILRVVWLYFVEPLDLSPTRDFALLAAVGVPAALIGTYLFFLVFERRFLRIL
jgi:peptidoglycan/LPS O-acetylase OafA/YrhL